HAPAAEGELRDAEQAGIDGGTGRAAGERKAGAGDRPDLLAGGSGRCDRVPGVGAGARTDRDRGGGWVIASRQECLASGPGSPLPLPAEHTPVYQRSKPDAIVDTTPAKRPARNQV